jgi:hypothetical protein
VPTRLVAWMRRIVAIAAVPLAAGAAHAQADSVVVRVVSGVDADGAATTEWRALLRHRLPDAAYDSVLTIRRRIAADERAWAEAIRARAETWPQRLDDVIGLFAPAAAPTRVTVVVGNRGAHDAFTHDATTIGFDLSALVREYGEPNPDLLDRLFRHEFVHLMQKAWWATHPFEMGTPLRRALAEMWAEGLGNFHSMSDRWRGAGGDASPTARQALAALEPRLLARLAALACAAPERESALTADLSWGRFDRKWGALTPALWLEAESRASSEALRAFVVAGPDGVWELAAKQLAPELRGVLEEIRDSADRCAPAT